MFKVDDDYVDDDDDVEEDTDEGRLSKALLKYIFLFLQETWEQKRYCQVPRDHEFHFLSTIVLINATYLKITQNRKSPLRLKMEASLIGQSIVVLA